jgi:DNA-binding CsgD family transcriptional regulator
MLDAGRTHVAFRHELARLAIEDAITPDRRLALHRQALAALAQRGSDFASLAHHAESAGDRDAVLRWAPRAAEQAASSGAHREAEAQYARALRFADSAAPDLRAALLEGWADECYVTARFESAIDALREALTCRRAIADRHGEGDVLRALARVLFFSGHTDAAEPLARDAVEILEGIPAGHELAMAYNTVSQRRMVLDDTDAAIRWGSRALELARALGDTEAEVYALANIGAAEFQVPGGNLTTLERALSLATEAGLEEYVGRALLLLVHVALRNRDYDVVRRYLGTGLEYCSARGLDTWRLYLEASRARMNVAQGRWDDAADAATSVLHDPRSAHVARSWALTTLGLIRARRGDSEVDVLLAEAHDLVRRTGELDRIGHLAAVRAEAAWLRGDPGSIDAMTRPAMALAIDRRMPWAVGDIVIWRWWAGIHDDLPPESLAEPYRLTMTGDAAAAADRWRELGCPYEAALALAAAGEPEALRQAIEELQRLGARPAAAIITRRLRQQGARGVPRGPRPRTREHPAGLTAREVEVLTLLTEGLRNAEIAKVLVVSTKTVDHHVSAILRKLGVHSRGEAAAEASRRGLLRGH